jgi:AmmeMemoRadiSam system protein A
VHGLALAKELLNIVHYSVSGYIHSGETDMQKQLSAKEKQLLLDIAREAIVSYVQTGAIPEREVNNGNLLVKQGCFVCIKINGMLRGCIGNFLSDKPLYRLVQEMAVSAATRDPRFYPMKENDLKDFDVEISVLSPLH